MSFLTEDRCQLLRLSRAHLLCPYTKGWRLLLEGLLSCQNADGASSSVHSCSGVRVGMASKGIAWPAARLCRLLASWPCCTFAGCATCSWRCSMATVAALRKQLQATFNEQELLSGPTNALHDRHKALTAEYRKVPLDLLLLQLSCCMHAAVNGSGRHSECS